MSYARWSNSSWYCYWNDRYDIPGEKKENQIMTINFSLSEGGDYKYSDLDLSDDDLKVYLNNEFFYATKKEIEELVVYVHTFIREVDAKY